MAGHDVGRAELDTLVELRKARRPNGKQTPADLEDALQDWIDARVLEDELSARGLDASPEYRKRVTAIQARARSAEQQLARRTLLEALEQDLVFSDEELKARYDEQQDRFFTTRIHLRQITVPERETILAIRKRLDEGTPFETLAAEANLDPRLREAAGDLGWLDQRRVPAVLVGAAHRLVQEGEVSEPFHDREGRWNLVQLVAREVGVRQSFDDVRDQLARELRVIRSRQLLDDRLTSRRQGMTVERLDPALQAGGEASAPSPSVSPRPAPGPGPS